jgi:hypothetical protein
MPRTGGSLDGPKKKVSNRPNAARPALTKTALAKAKKAWPNKKFELVRSPLSFSTRSRLAWRFCHESMVLRLTVYRFETRMSLTPGSAPASGLS